VSRFRHTPMMRPNEDAAAETGKQKSDLPARHLVG
jgi:hypothetical protein